jgi:hypothetical protein
MKTEWRYPFDDNGLNYLSRKAKQINDIAALLGVPAPGLAGGIAREMTLQRREYPNNPADRRTTCEGAVDFDRVGRARA